MKQRFRTGPIFLATGLLSVVLVTIAIYWSVSRSDSQPEDTTLAKQDRIGSISPSTRSRIAHVESPGERPRDERTANALRDPRARFDAKLRSVAEQRGDQPLPPGESRKITAEALAATGISNEPWTRDAASTYSMLLDEIKGLPEGADLTISSPTCYAAGCTVTLTFPPSVDSVMLSHAMSSTKAIIAWPGGKLATPAELMPSGRKESNWILIRPN